MQISNERKQNQLLQAIGLSMDNKKQIRANNVLEKRHILSADLIAWQYRPQPCRNYSGLYELPDMYIMYG